MAPDSAKRTPRWRLTSPRAMLDSQALKVQIDFLRELSTQMLASAAASAWTVVAALDAKRHQELEAVFERNDRSELARYRAELSELGEMDARISNMIRQARDDAASQLEDLRRARFGTQAYEQHSL